MKHIPLDQRAGWMQTFTGKKFFPLDPQPSLICIEDIAHALSLQCRFGGHCNQFYSVAQHSLHVEKLCPGDPELKLVALMHDAPEAFLGDMIRPLKYLTPQYQAAEQRLWEAICARFNLPAHLIEAVKEYDNLALVTERRDLLGPACAPWVADLEALTPDPRPLEFLHMPPSWHEHCFKVRFSLLMDARLTKS